MPRKHLLLIALLWPMALFARPPLPIVNLGNDTSICIGDSINLVAFQLSGNATYSWQDGSTFHSFMAKDTGVYWVDVTNSCGTVRDSFVLGHLFPPAPVGFGADTILCPGQDLLLDAFQPDAFYFWQDNSSNASFLVTGPGQYSVIVNNVCGFVADTIEVSSLNPPLPVDLGRDTIVCQGVELWLTASQTDVAYLWQNGAMTDSFLVQGPGLYHVQLSNHCGSEADSIQVDYLAPPAPFSLGADSTLCIGDSLIMDASQSDMDYLWQDLSTDSVFTAFTSGSYFVTVINDCGIERDSLELLFIDAPAQANLGPDTTICEGQGLFLDVSQTHAEYLWDDGSDQPIRLLNIEGSYWVEVFNICGSNRDSLSLNLMQGPDPTSLGNDTIICPNTTITLDVLQEGASYLWNNGDTLSSLTITQGGVYWVEISNRCGLELDNIIIEDLAPPQTPNLGEDTTICWGMIHWLDAGIGQPPADYLWNDGSTDPVNLALEAREYSVMISNACGVAFDEILIDTISPPPIISIGPDTTLCLDDFPIVLEARFHSRPDVQVSWHNGDSIPLFMADGPGEYMVRLENKCAVVQSTRILSGADCDCTVYMATAFSPNNDGINESFGPVFDCEIRNWDFAIFDRWGRLVFRSNSPEFHWDGTSNGHACPEGVYTYLLNYTAAELDYVFDIPKKGTVTLIR